MEKTYIVTVRLVTESDTSTRTRTKSNHTYFGAVLLTACYLFFAILGIMIDADKSPLFISLLSFWLSIFFLDVSAAVLSTIFKWTKGSSLILDGTRFFLTVFFTMLTFFVLGNINLDNLFHGRLCDILTILAIALFLFQKSIPQIQKTRSHRKKQKVTKPKTEMSC